MAVPFVGWSRAAHNFRNLVANESSCRSFLIVGEPGVGKRTMAEAIRSHLKLSESRLPTISISDETTKVPAHCIAISANPTAYGRFIPEGRHVPQRIATLATRNLGTNKNEPIPESECLNFPSLQDALVAQFDLKMYMPPLRRRQIDCLALLHFYGTQVLPREKANCSAISSYLIHQLLLDSRWIGNVSEFVNVVRSAAMKSTELIQSSAIQGKFTFHDPIPKFLEFDKSDWQCENVDVPFKNLPHVGVAILASRFWSSVSDKSASPVDNGASSFLLGPDEFWGTERCSLLGRGLRESNLDDFLKAICRESFPRNELSRGELIKRIQNFETLGCNIDSLTSGIQASLDRVSSKALKQFTLRPAKRRVAPRKLQGQPLSDSEKKILDLFGQGFISARIADSLEISASFVSKALNKGMAKLSEEGRRALTKKHASNRPRKQKEKLPLPKDRRGNETIAFNDEPPDETDV